MKLIFFSNKFPTEEPSDIFRQLRQQSRSDSHIILRQLLKEATLAVRDEIRLLPAELRSCLPPFRCILDLAEHYDWHRGPLAGTFECVFLCLSSLGLFVG
jgi:monodictyphenone polyketide synthase